MWRTPIKADLRALANAFTTSEGRKAILAAAIGVVSMGLGSLMLLGRLALAGPLREGLADGASNAYQLVASIVIIVPLLLAAALAVVQARKELFESPQATMLLIAPIGRLSIIGRVWLRLLFTAVLFALAVGIPPIVRAVAETPMRATAVLLYPLVAVVFASPVVAGGVLFQVVRARFLSGPRMRLAIQATGVGSAMVMTAIALMGLLSSQGQLARVVSDLLASGVAEWAQAWSLAPWLARAAGGEIAVSWIAWTWPPVVTVVTLFIASRLVRGAFAQAAIVEPGLVRGRFRGLGRAWPEHAFTSIIWKDVCGVLQDRGGIVSLVFFFGLQLVLMKTGLYSRAIRSAAIPLPVAHAFGMLVSMQVLCVFLGGLQSLSIIGSERKQSAMLATAPVTYPILLAGKSFMVAMPFLWCALACVIGAPPLAGAPWEAITLFVPMATAITLFNSGVVVAAGTWPPLFDVDENVPINNSLQSLVPAVLTTVSLGLTIGITLWIRSRLVAEYAIDPAAANARVVAWVVAMLSTGVGMAAVGFAVGVRHLRRVFGPRW